MPSLFTGPQDDPLKGPASTPPNPSIQNSLDAFRNGLSASDQAALDPVAIIVVAATDTAHPWGGHRETEEHYSASLLKMAAMYAAYDLRRYARDFLDTDSPPQTTPDFYAALAAGNPDIQAAAPALITDHLYPDYPSVLSIGTDSGGVPDTVDFTAAFLTNMQAMIEQSDDPAAAACIHGLGFGYLNAKLADNGFLTTDNPPAGVWLAGDYQGQWNPVRIPTVNDGGSAQATTAYDLAKLMTLMFDHRLVDDDSCTDMIAMMTQVPSWFSFTMPPLWAPGRTVSVTAAKVGIGPLKPPPGAPGMQVVSEAEIIHDSGRDLDFVAVWQNVPTSGQPTAADLTLVAAAIDAAVQGYAPLSP